MTITPTPDTPVGVTTALALDEDNVLSAELQAIDVDRQTAFTFALVSDEGAANGSVAVSPEGVLTYTPDADFNGQ